MAKDKHLSGVRSKRTEMHTAIDQIDVCLAIIGLEDELRGIGEDQADSDGHEDLHEV